MSENITTTPLDLSSLDVTQGEVDREWENQQWLRFAEVFAPQCGWRREFDPNKNKYVEVWETGRIADFADAMIKEAKNRGRL